MAKATKEAHALAVRKYDAKNTKQYHLKLNLGTDAKIIAKLDSVDSIQGYIKKLINDDINKRNDAWTIR